MQPARLPVVGCAVRDPLEVGDPCIRALLNTGFLRISSLRIICAKIKVSRANNNVWRAKINVSCDTMNVRRANIKVSCAIINVRRANLKVKWCR